MNSNLLSGLPEVKAGMLNGEFLRRDLTAGLLNILPFRLLLKNAILASISSAPSSQCGEADYSRWKDVAIILNCLKTSLSHAL